MDKYVVSLEVAKKLKEAGWNKKSHFYYVKDNVFEDNANYSLHFGQPVYAVSFYAPIAEEIIEHLLIEGRIMWGSDFKDRHDNNYEMWVHSLVGGEVKSARGRGKTFADACANLYLDCKSNNLLKE